MTLCNSSRRAIFITIALLALLLLVSQPSHAHAAPPGPFSPLQTIPGWLEEAIEGLLQVLQAELVKVLQDASRLLGVLLWGVLKVCGMVGLFAEDFSALFGTVVTEALNAVVTGDVHDLIRGSLLVSLGIFGLSLLARPFWPDLRLVSFQRAAIWGIAIQAYLASAPIIYTELETWRVDLAEQVASAVSTGAIPGCPGGVVEVLLCITGTSPAEVLDPDLSNLPNQLPYGGSESVHDLYEHCVYNPPVLYGDPACDPDDPVGDPWEVLDHAQDALGTQLLSLILALLILAYGILQISLGLAAGMMFVLFPVAAIFAFYLPLESFAAGVIRNYISIFLKSIVLLTMAGIVIRLFSIAAGSLTAMAAVALVDLLLCCVMAKEALASLLGAISFVGSSVSAIGTNLGLTGGGSSPSPAPGAASYAASSMMSNSATLQTLMGSPQPFNGAGSTVLGAAGSALGSPVRAGQAAAQAAVATGSGGLGALAGATLAAKGVNGSAHELNLGSLALMGSALTSTLGQDAGRGFVAGAGAIAMKQVLQGRRGQRPASGQEQRPPRQESSPSEEEEPALLVPRVQPAQDAGDNSPGETVLPDGVQLMDRLAPDSEAVTLNAVNAGLRREKVAAQDQPLPSTSMPPAEKTPAQVSPAPGSSTLAAMIETTEQAPSPVADSAASDLYNQLCAWRTETARESGQKAFQVFPNATLERIAQARPQTMEELREVKGVGPKKLEQYGAAVLGITQPVTGQVPADPAVVKRSAASTPSPAEPAAEAATMPRESVVQPTLAPKPRARHPEPPARATPDDKGYDLAGEGKGKS